MIIQIIFLASNMRKYKKKNCFKNYYFIYYRKKQHNNAQYCIFTVDFLLILGRQSKQLTGTQVIQTGLPSWSQSQGRNVNQNEVHICETLSNHCENILAHMMSDKILTKMPEANVR